MDNTHSSYYIPYCVEIDAKWFKTLEFVYLSLCLSMCVCLCVCVCVYSVYKARDLKILNFTKKIFISEKNLFKISVLIMWMRFVNFFYIFFDHLIRFSSLILFLYSKVLIDWFYCIEFSLLFFLSICGNMNYEFECLID